MSTLRCDMTIQVYSDTSTAKILPHASPKIPNFAPHPIPSLEETDRIE